MFDGVPDQLHQFIASRTSLPIPLTFPIHGNTTTTFPSFDDPYPSSNQPVLLRPLLHHPSPTHIDEDHREDNINHSLMISKNLVLERERSDPWSNDEVLALLRIRSSLESWFPDFTWEHVSRKLAEVGFKRSAEKCKDKFEEESRYFNNINTNYNNNNKNNYRFISELEELCHGYEETTENDHIEDENNIEKMVVEKPNEKEVDKIVQSLVEEEVGIVVKKSKGKKRKRKFEMMKCFCEDVVKMIMAQQEELYNKILEDMVKRDEENMAREEAWKKQEMDRFNKEVEIRANEQALAGDRQATINEFFNKLTSSQDSQNLFLVPNSSNNPTSPSTILAQNPSPSSSMGVAHQNPSSSPNYQSDPNVPTLPNLDQAGQNPKSVNSQHDPSMPTSNSTQKTHQNPNFGSNNDEDKDHIGKRWPRDEVLALINIRSNFYNTSEDKEGSANSKGPLWEKISQGMLELGYKRSAKRCKEKWENINKYFRKTRDNVNKKRSFDSRTCPYFHQLSNLYKKGTPSNWSENHSSSPENHPNFPETCPGFSLGVSNKANKHADQGETNMIQTPSFDFEF